MRSVVCCSETVNLGANWSNKILMSVSVCVCCVLALFVVTKRVLLNWVLILKVDKIWCWLSSMSSTNNAACVCGYLLLSLSPCGVRFYSLLPSQATIFTLSTRANSCTSRNSTSFSINVQTLSQNRYVFNLAALNVTRALTFVFSAVFIDLSNCNRTLSANCGVIWPNYIYHKQITN